MLLPYDSLYLEFNARRYNFEYPMCQRNVLTDIRRGPCALRGDEAEQSLMPNNDIYRRGKTFAGKATGDHRQGFPGKRY